jgi:hypothetical protein
MTLAALCGVATVMTVTGVPASGYEAGNDSALAAPGWTVQPTPGTGGALNGVSCTSANACTAVGQANAETLAERWNGTAWATQPTPNLGGTLYGVSCLTATACTAVGDVVSDPSTPLAEQWAGGTWSVTLNQGEGILRGVSCTSGSACTAVGGYLRSFPYPGHTPPFRAAYQTRAEQSTGTSWSVQTTPDEGTALALTNWLYSVSCTGANACLAVGQVGIAGQLKLRWDGTAWSVQPIADYLGQVYTLYGVSCASATACTAVGQLLPGFPSVQRWDGTRWWQQTVPVPLWARAASLYGVSCPSATACTAVGNYTSSSGVKETLAEQWNGTTWTVAPTPNPAGATSSTLSGVSCPSANACTAVGNYVSSSGAQETLAEEYGG